MKNKLKLATVTLHISAAFYCILALLITVFPYLTPNTMEGQRSLVYAFVFIGSFCLLLAVGVEVVVWGVRNRKFWAWVAGLIVFGVYVPSLFMPLGMLGLWSLLDSGSRKAFGVGTKAKS